jgi:hypothetical protein
VQNIPRRRLQSKIAAIPIQASIIGKPLRVPATTDLVICLKKTAEACADIAFTISFKSGSRQDVENAVGPVAIFRVIAPPLDL